MRDAYVLDTGVALRWWVPQVGHEHAREVQAAALSGEVRLRTPESARFEVANTLRTKGLLKGRLTRGEYLVAVRELDVLGVVVPISPDQLVSAAALAADRMLRLFDALFVDLALREGMALLTSDRGLALAVGDLLDVEVLRGIGADPSP